MNLTDKYTKKTIQTPSIKNMTAIIIGGHRRWNGWTLSVRAWLAWPANTPHSMLWFVVPPAQGGLGQVLTRGQDDIVASYGGRRREFHPFRHPVRLRELSTSRPLRIV
jgi:hypothetical protein